MSEFGRVLGVRTDKTMFPLVNALVQQEGIAAAIQASSFLHCELLTKPCGKCQTLGAQDVGNHDQDRPGASLRTASLRLCTMEKGLGESFP